MRSSSTDRPPARYGLALALVTLAAVVALLGAAEIAVRVRMYFKYGLMTQAETFYTVDPVLHLRVPKKSFSSGHISTNSLGFRGPELRVPKPADVLRIAFVGASTTWCAEVSSNELAWPALVTQKLARTFPQRTFDYINAGVPGYTLESIQRNLEYRVLPLEPDIVVFYEATNNLSGELRERAFEHGLIPDTTVHEVSWLGRYSLLWNLVEKNLRVLFAERAAVSNRKPLVLDTSVMGAEYREWLTRIVSTARQKAKLVVIATFSTQLRRDQTPEQQARAASSAFFYMPFATPSLMIDSYDRYNAIAREVARDTGALLIEGENDIPGDPVHFVDTVHFTDEGSKAMAERISRALTASPRFVEIVGASAAAAMSLR